MKALRASADVADIRLERKLRYGCAKLKARGQFRSRTRHASAVPEAVGSFQAVTNNTPAHTTIGEKRSWSQDEPCRDAQKYPWHMGNPAEGVPSKAQGQSCQGVSTIPGTPATSPDDSIDPEDDVVSGVSLHETGGSLAHGAASVVLGIPQAEHEKLLLEMSCLRDTLGKNQSALDGTQTRVQAL